MRCQIDVGEQIEHTAYEYDFGIVHLATFSCELKEGKPLLTEHAAIKWLWPNELKLLDWVPADMPTINRLSSMSFIN